MAAPKGFDAIVGSAAVTAPFVAGDVLLSVPVPARTVVAALDLSAGALDSGGVPLLTLDVGDDALTTRFVAGTTVAQAGGKLEVRPVTAGWWRYSQASAVTVRVGADAAVDASGALALTLYTYPGVDVTTAITQTLSRLGVLAEGETPRAEYANEAEQALAEVHEMMRGRGLASRQDMAWPLALIPVFAVRAYASMAANLLAETFALPMPRKQLMAQRAAEAERELRRMTRVAYDGEPVDLEPYEPKAKAADYGIFAP